MRQASRQARSRRFAIGNHACRPSAFSINVARGESSAEPENRTTWVFARSFLKKIEQVLTERWRNLLNPCGPTNHHQKGKAVAAWATR
jgi:hypothetical protein